MKNLFTFLSETIIGGIISLITAILAPYKIYSELVLKRRDRLRADYDLVEKLIANDRWKTMHDLQLEVGFQCLLNRRIKSDVIRFFLSHENAYQNLLNFIIGQRFLTTKKNTEYGSTITLLEPLTKKKIRRKYNKLFIAYILFYVLGALPILYVLIFGYPSHLENSLTSMQWWLAIWVIDAWMFAYFKLQAMNALKAAERIISLCN